MTSRVQILNRLIAVFGYERYLEIGTYLGKTYRGVGVPFKRGVDPRVRLWSLFRPDVKRVQSDRFFAGNRHRFDVAFIDGLHIAEQADRDVRNCWRCIGGRGAILMHDCLPSSEEAQEVPRRAVTWQGNVWRAFSKAAQDPLVFPVLFEADFGCGLLLREPVRQRAVRPPADIDFMDPSLPWVAWEKNRGDWFTTVPVHDTLAYIDALGAEVRENKN